MRGIFALFPILFLCAISAAFTTSCSPAVSTSIPFEDNFDRVDLGENWLDNMGGRWEIKDRKLHSNGSQNAPLWLRARLPDNAVIEFDAYTDPNICDIKCEAFADGRTHATGYILLMGGWKNRTSTIARLDEHQQDRLEKRSDCVPGKAYHWRIERRGNVLSWFVDDKLYLQLNDPNPLKGRGHDRFAFNNWASDVYFDNLRIRELK
ncbi:MAG: hypothetical protein WC889_15740 [Myxococcota bacterium]|jgi:hypothetical protein